ncbi:MAG: hypothetical protein J5685_02710 [Clostridiales bacterium]|nr:hypothetical protein [Clostridiales bacterium]
MDMNLTYSIMYLEINLISVIMVAFVHYKTSGLTKMVPKQVIGNRCFPVLGSVKRT